MESEDMRTHLSILNTLCERLGEIGSPLSDVQFNAYIRTSLSLATCYQPLLTTLSTTTRQTKTALSSNDLMWHLVEEANTVKLGVSINKAHAKSNRGSSDKGKGRDRKKAKKSGLHCSNPNCKMKGHTTENCFAKGGGKEHQAPEWWKQKQEAKAKVLRHTKTK